MKKIMITGFVVFGTAVLMADPYHHHDSGVRKAADIVNLVNSSVRLANTIANPRPVVVTPAPAPAVVAPPRIAACG